MRRRFDPDPFAGLHLDNGNLERPVVTPMISVPSRVALEGDRLVFRDVWDFGPRVQPGAPMLTEFVKLRDAPAERIRNYAARWGLLFICEHGLPITHNPPQASLTDDGGWREEEGGCAPLGFVETDGAVIYEPLEAWRGFARE